MGNEDMVVIWLQTNINCSQPASKQHHSNTQQWKRNKMKRNEMERNGIESPRITIQRNHFHEQTTERKRGKNAQQKKKISRKTNKPAFQVESRRQHCLSKAQRKSKIQTRKQHRENQYEKWENEKIRKCKEAPAAAAAASIWSICVILVLHISRYITWWRVWAKFYYVLNKLDKTIPKQFFLQTSYISVHQVLKWTREIQLPNTFIKAERCILMRAAFPIWIAFFITIRMALVSR